MTTENEATMEIQDDYAPILPDGWADEGDLFDDADDVTDVDTVTSSDAAPDAMDADTAANSEAPTTEPGEDAVKETDQTAEETPTTESDDSQTVDPMLRFKARVDHEDVDVELKESELPTIYQKSRVADRAQKRLSELTPTVEAATRLAKQMGYATPQEMLDAAAKSYHDSEIEKLTSEGVHPEVARDIVERRMGDAVTRPETEEARVDSAPAEPKAPKRDYQAEVEELLQARPNLRGKQLPDEVSKAAVAGNRRLLLAYMDYEARQAQAENERLRRENEIYKQNAATAARSPVKGVSGGGPTDTRPSDPFLDGFNTSDW